MAAKLVGMALETRGLTPVAKLVLVGLADCSNALTGACFPSKAWLADVAEVSERHVQRCIKTLEERGLITVNRRSGKSSYYGLFPNGPETLGLPPPETPRHPTRDIAVSPTRDTAMSPESERTRKNRDESDADTVDNFAPHHFCRTAMAFIDNPKSMCPDCTESEKEATI